MFLFVRSERHGEWLLFFVVALVLVFCILRFLQSSFLKGLSSSLRRLSLSLSLAADAADADADAVAALSLNEFDDEDDEDSFTRAQINTRIILLTFSLSPIQYNKTDGCGDSRNRTVLGDENRERLPDAKAEPGVGVDQEQILRD